jgi:DNA polymerase-3 subunit delta'
VPRLGDIREQDRAVEQLRRALQATRVPHAYLFTGPEGAGKRQAAVTLFAALACESSPGEGCDACTTCTRAAADGHPDLLVLRPGGAGRVVAIDDLRATIARLPFAPHEARARLIVVEEADRMQEPAQNAFLKTLEEPPARTHIVLTTVAPEKLLPTIRSRCQTVRFQAVVAAEVLEARRARVAALLAAVAAPGIRPVLETAAQVAQEKEEIMPTLDLLARHYRDAAALAVGVSQAVLLHPERVAELGPDTPWGAGALARRAAVVLDTQTAVLGFVNATLALEHMLLALREVTS